MTPDDVADAIDAVGETIVLRRVNGPGRFVAVITKARMDTPAAQNNELPGGARQFASQFRIHNRDILTRKWPGPPRRGDQVITADGHTITVQSVDTLKLGDDVASFILQTTGSA